MICKKCQTENDDGAVFCKHCGRRLDGMITCPSCGATCAEDARFCSACGASLSAQYAPSQPQYAKKNAPEQGGIWSKVKFAFDLSGSICAITAVFFALLFTFFIGFTTYMENDGVTKVWSTSTLWVYFGSAYKNIGKILEIENFSSLFSASYYLPVVFGTIVSAATLITVITF